MNIKKNMFIRNLSFSFITNFLALLISTILIIFIPKFIGVTSYGYFQLYLFYTTYISYMSLGITDGIYLRSGGEEYKNLEKTVLGAQFWFLVIFNFFVNLIFGISYVLLSDNTDKNFIVLATCFVGLMIVPRSLLTFVLQATNKIKEYSIIILIEKIVYFILVLLTLLLEYADFRIIVYADLIGKLASVIYGVYICRDIVFSKLCSFKLFLEELSINFKVGIKLFVANLSSMLIIGIVRLFIEKGWSIEIFGKVSLSLSISNMVLIFLNTVGIVLFPLLRKLDYSKQIEYYVLIKSILMPTLFFCLLLFQPVVLILLKILPLYEDSFIYMGLLFPIIIYEGKTVVLVNTYLKTLRKEKIMFKVNLFVVLISMILSYLFSMIYHNLYIMVLLIVIVVAIRNAILEIYLSNIMDIQVIKDIIVEFLLTGIFILTTIYFERLIAFTIFFICYLLYLIINKDFLMSNLKKYKISKDAKK